MTYFSECVYTMLHMQMPVRVVLLTKPVDGSHLHAAAHRLFGCDKSDTECAGD